jgi:hypothetical protein
MPISTLTPPTVIYPLTLPTLLQHVLSTQSSTAHTTLIICSSRESFLQDLLTSLQQQEDEHDAETLQRLITPTLHNLATARHVKVAFCASVQTLLAYLTAYSNGGGDEKSKERLVLVNPLGLHAPTPSFSAQGLSRTFAAVVETATRVGAVLVVAECQKSARDTTVDRGYAGEIDVDMERADESPHEDAIEVDPWEQEVAILNVSAKKYGSGNSDRAWAGRTVKVKTVAARWFHFHKLSVPGREPPW